MKLQRTLKALADLARVHGHVVPSRPYPAGHFVADATLRSLASAAGRLVASPNAGDALDQFAPRQVRQLVVGRYELRYEVGSEAIVILRLWRSSKELSEISALP